LYATGVVLFECLTGRLLPGRLFSECIERGFAIADRFHGVPMRTQKPREQLAVRGLIVHHQDRGASWRPYGH